MPAPLPMIVVSGYLGAGKTTLINRLLRNANGRRIMVLVNDFGTMNIDADLLETADEDTLTLTNGCVCCTMGADLFMALADALDRRPRPDVLLVEASGIAEPRRIAEAARAEPELRYGGIVTVVDAFNFLRSADDSQIGPQVCGQVIAADLLAVAKSSALPPLLDRLSRLNPAPVMAADSVDLAVLLLAEPAAADASIPAHPEYAQWAYTGQARLSLTALKQKLAAPPEGVFRIKGFVRDPENGGWEVHLVGSTVDIRRAADVKQTALVAIGLRSRFAPEAARRWWP
jgi:G3E family GTPase